MEFSVKQILDTNKGGFVSNEDKFKYVFESIGEHIIANSTKYARSMGDTCSKSSLTVELDPNSIVTIKFSTENVVLNKKENE